MTLYVFCYNTSSSLSCSVNARSFLFFQWGVGGEGRGGCWLGKDSGGGK